MYEQFINKSYISEYMAQSLLVFLALLSVALTAHTLKKVVLTDPDALCLDGTKGAYYIVDGKQSTKFLLSFQGGGWCGSSSGLNQSLDNCLARSKTALGSSSNYTDNISASAGILSDQAQNHFKDWTIAHFKYCDGTGHQGYKKDAVSYKGASLHFRGHNVTIGQLNSIDQTHKLFSVATEIAITGQSAGGLATFLWTNYIASRAPKTAKVWSIPDSGIFLDQTNYVTKLNNYKLLFQNFMKLANEQVDPPTAECVAAHSTQKWKCLFAQYNYAYIKVPLFPIQSAYDSWSLPNILGINCQSGGSLANCDAGSLAYIEQYHANTTAVLKKIASNKSNGFWSPSCSNHVYSTGGDYISTAYRIPSGSQYSLAFCIQEWITSKPVNYEHYDNGNWPINKPCSGVALSVAQE